MSLLDILPWRRKSAQSFYTNRSQDSFASRWARPPSKNTSEWLSMFSKSPRLAVVDRIASDLANVKGHLYRIDADGTEVEITNHPFLDFMEQPNPLYEMTNSAVWRLHEVYLLLVGESYFVMERNKSGMPSELWNVPPHWVKSTPYAGSPTYQIISPNGVSMQVPIEDMFVMKHLNPLDPYMRGLGIAESIADEVEIDEYAAKFQKRFFYNDATPPVVFLMPDATPDQRNAFMARWNQAHQGVENSHMAAALTGNVSVLEIGGNSNKNLDFIESRIAMRDAVLEHFGVPREIMGITENSNRSTADSAQYIYAKNVLTPRIKQREDAINKQLLPLFEEGLTWRYDAIIPYDKEFDKSKALEGYNAGLLTKNEARRLINMPDVDGGDVYRVGINDLFLSESEDPVEVTKALLEDDLPVEADVKAKRRVNISAFLRKEDILLQENIRSFEAAISQHFASQMRELSKTLGEGVKAEPHNALEQLDDFLLPDGTFDPELWAALSETEQKQMTDAIVSGLLNWREEAKKLNQLFFPLWKKAYEDGADLSKDSYGIVEIQRPEFVSAAKIHGGKRIVGIQQTTRNNIAAIIARGVENGSSQAELRKSIQSEMVGSSAARVKLIARQETMTALATGQFDMMENAGAQTKTWHHRPQKNPRDGKHGTVNHVALEGETVSIDEKFSNGLRYPRDPEENRPEEIINCRCYITYGGF